MSKYHPLPPRLLVDRRFTALSVPAKLLHIYAHVVSDEAETDGQHEQMQIRAMAVQAGIPGNRVNGLVRELLAAGLWELHDNIVYITDFVGTTHAQMEAKREKWSADKTRQRATNRLPSGSDPGTELVPNWYPSGSVSTGGHRAVSTGGHSALLNSKSPEVKTKNPPEVKTMSTDYTSRQVITQAAAAARAREDADEGAGRAVLAFWTKLTGKVVTDAEREMVEAMVPTCGVPSMLNDIETTIGKGVEVRSLRYFEKRWQERATTSTDETSPMSDEEVARFMEHYSHHDGCRGRHCDVWLSGFG